MALPGMTPSLEMQTTTPMTAEEIHQLGLSEVKRIHAAMDAIRISTGFKGDMPAFFEFMRTDKQFYLPDTDEGRAQYLKLAEGYIGEMYKKLPDYFGRLPKAPVEVRRVPAFREVPGGAAHYFGPTPDGAQPGIFYAHLVDMSAVSLWALESLAYHEAIPGHHMQIAIQNELTDIPLFRTQYGYSAFSEGWGLYAEELGKEMGMFTDPYNDFGRPQLRAVACGATGAGHGPARQGLDRGRSRGLGDGELGASAKLDQERGAPLPAVAGTGDHLQDRHDQDPAAARRSAEGAGRQVRHQGLPRHGGHRRLDAVAGA
jgi:hypothetical protein